MKLSRFESTEDFCYELGKLENARWWSRGESNTVMQAYELVKRLAIGRILAQKKRPAEAERIESPVAEHSQ